MTALNQAILYLLVALIRVADPVAELSADYFQNSVPMGEFIIRTVPGGDADVFQISFSSLETDESGPTSASETVEAGFPLRLEQSDLYTHQYIANPAGEPARLIDLSAVNRWLAGAEWQGSEAITGPLHLISREPLVILVAEAEQIILIAR